MMRMLFSLGMMGVFAAGVLAMWRGGRARAMRQDISLPPFPSPPKALHGNLGRELLPPISGVYIGTTSSGDWQDRIVVGDVGHRCEATLHLSRSGLLVDRFGASPL